MLYFLILICSQIILESFPVSSSGHLLLLENFINYFSYPNVLFISSGKMLAYFLHGPTVIILAIFFFDQWYFLLKYYRRCWKMILKIVGFVFIADLATSAWYFFYYKTSFIAYSSVFPIGLGFFISLFFLLSLKFCKRERPLKLTWKKALFIGLVQGFALLPGISRFGLTFVAGRWVGLSARRSFEFSFAIQWPLILAGFLRSILAIYVGKFNLLCLPIFNWYGLLAVLVSSIIAFYALRFVRFMALDNKLWYFSVFLSFSFILWFIFVYIIL